MKIRNSWADVTVNEYYKMLDIYNNSNLNEFEQKIAIYELLTGETIDDKMSMQQFNSAFDNYKFIQTAPPQDQYIENEYTIGGRKFKMCKKPHEITVNQFQDIDTICKGEPNDKQIHIFAAILFTPKGKEYGEYDVNEMVEFMLNNLTMDIANNLVVFFSRFQINALNFCMENLQKEVKKELKKEMKNPMKMNIQKAMKMNNFLKYMDSCQ